jgi:hypothetical protein
MLWKVYRAKLNGKGISYGVSPSVHRQRLPIRRSAASQANPSQPYAQQPERVLIDENIYIRPGTSQNSGRSHRRKTSQAAVIEGVIPKSRFRTSVNARSHFPTNPLRFAGDKTSI